MVRRARLAYGGVAAMPGRARHAEAALEGRKWESEVASTIDGILCEEFKPIDDARGGAEYRRNLVVSLWQKFIPVNGVRPRMPIWISLPTADGQSMITRGR